MNAEGFIADRLRFKGKVAVIAIAISFFVMIVAVAVSGGFRKEIRSGVSSVTGDVLLTNEYFNYHSDSFPIDTDPSYLPDIQAVSGVEKVTPAIYRAGIVKNEDDIYGVLFKGTPGDTLSMSARVPSKLADEMGVKVGDNLLAYFVSEKVKVRKFTVTEIYESLIDAEESLIVYVPIKDLRRLNEWEDNQASLLEVTLDDRFHDRKAMRYKAEQIGAISYMTADSDEESLAATSAAEKYAQLFDWLDLIDANVYAIILLMTIVAGFNMISGLLILLFRNISTIGTLKSLGMTDKSIAGVFLRVSARIVAVGMVVGNVLALLFCFIQGSTHLLKLNPENYFVSFVPVSVGIPQILIADVIAFAVIMLFLLIPSLFISKIDPSETVKTE